MASAGFHFTSSDADLIKGHVHEHEGAPLMLSVECGSSNAVLYFPNGAGGVLVARALATALTTLADDADARMASRAALESAPAPCVGEEEARS